MKTAMLAALLALVVSPSGAQTAAGEIEKANLQFALALNKGDAALLARMYTDRAMVLPPKADIIEGREAIQDYWRSVIAAGLKNLSLQRIRVDEYGGDTAREIGRFSIEEPSGPGAVEGKYVVVWRKNGGAWQHDSDIWNFTNPLEPDGASGAPAVPGSAIPSPSR